MLAHVFAQKTISNLEPIVAKTTAILVAEIDKSAIAGTSLNMRRYLNYYTIDLFSEQMCGRSLGCIERGDDLVDASTADDRVYKALFIKSLHETTE